MTATERLIRVAGAAVVVVAIGLGGVWLWSAQSESSESALLGGEPTQIAAPTADPTVPPPAATPTPVPTPTPTPTPVPTSLPLTEAAPLGTLADMMVSPLPDCGLLTDSTIVAGTVTLRCIETWSSVPVVAVAAGRVVNVVNEPAQPADGLSVTPAGMWVWADQAELGPHVVIDHGPIGGTSNSQTVYAGLASIGDEISLGSVVVAGQELGSVSGPQAALQFSLWTNNVRHDGARVVELGPSADEQRAAAAALRDVISSPTDERCPLVLGFGQLPGAPRQYRNGTHQGIDFGCGAADRSGFAIADGTVVYLVDDYDDPSVPEREALLQLAGIAGFTPHWTLVMLYGNVVVIDHGDIAGAGRVVTITAHLEEVDPAITLGGSVRQGQRLGELGNRGTNASALNIRGDADPSLHLHWELFIDNWFLGSGLDGATVTELISTALCGAAETAGCAP